MQHNNRLLMKNNKKVSKGLFWASLLIVLGAILLCCLVSFREASIIQEYNNKATYENKSSGDIHLTDEYDTDNSNLLDFFMQEDSMEIMQRTYNILSRTGTGFLEVTMQPFEYLGYLSINDMFTDGEDAEQVNQFCNSEFFTPLKSMQISKTAANMLGINDQFELIEDTNNNPDEIGVLMGSDYATKFSVGDTFYVRYLGIKKIHCKVIGFLKKDTKIIIDGSEINLNKYILAESLAWDNYDTDEYKKALLSVRLEGYLRYNNTNQREKCISLIKSIRNDAGYMYEVPRIRKEFDTMIGLSYLPTGILLIGSFAAFLMVCYKIVIIINKSGERDIMGKNVIASVILLAFACSTCLIEAAAAPHYADDIKGCFNHFLIIVMVSFLLSYFVFRINDK